MPNFFFSLLQTISCTFCYLFLIFLKSKPMSTILNLEQTPDISLSSWLCCKPTFVYLLDSRANRTASTFLTTVQTRLRSIFLIFIQSKGISNFCLLSCKSNLCLSSWHSPNQTVVHLLDCRVNLILVHLLESRTKPSCLFVFDTRAIHACKCFFFILLATKRMSTF